MKNTKSETNSICFSLSVKQPQRIESYFWQEKQKISNEILKDTTAKDTTAKEIAKSMRY